MKLHVIEGTVHSWEGFMAKQAKAKKSPGPKREREKRDQDWIGILATITPQTRVIALVAMISEALFVAASFSIPDGQRLVAFLACAGLLIVAIGACVWLELSQRPTQEPITARVQLPNELAGNAFWIDPATQKDRSAVGDLERSSPFVGAAEEVARPAGIVGGAGDLGHQLVEARLFKSAGGVPSRSAFIVAWIACTAAWKGWWPCRDTRTPLPAR